MNWLDKAIGWVSPSAGLKRVKARAALELIRGYDGAKVGRRTNGWTTGGTSANAEIQPALAWLRNRSHDLVRNNPYARKAINTLVSRSIGTGIQVKSALGDQYEAWIEECDADEQLDFYGLQALVARTVFESGECLVRFRNRRPDDGLAIPLQIQVLEPDFLDSNVNGPLKNGNIAIAGVEFNLIGKRVAYWLFDQHPGEVSAIPRALQSRRVPATEVLHIYEKERPGQVRGVPRLAVSIIKLKDFDDYEEAELVRKKIEACFAAFVTTSAEDNPLTPAKDSGGKRVETVEPGIITYLKPGEEVTFGAPNYIGSGYREYGNTQLHAIATGAGVTFEQLTGDLSGVNYSSIRAGMVEFRALVEMFQWLTYIPMFCKPVHRRLVDTAFIAGSIKTRQYKTTCTTPKWPWVDPLKDIQAEEKAVAGNFKSRSESIRESGYDPDKVFQEIAEEKNKMEKLGITPSTQKSVVKETKEEKDDE